MNECECKTGERNEHFERQRERKREEREGERKDFRIMKFGVKRK